MNLQAQPKGQNKRKRCLFGDQEAAPKEQPPPLQAPQQPPGPPQSTRVKEEPYFGHEGPTGAAPASQPVELPNSLALLNSVVYGSERTPATMLPQQVGSKWPNSVMAPGRVPEHGGGGGASDSGWQQQPGQPPPHPAWNCHSLPFYAGHKGSPHPGMGVSPYYNHPEALKREKGGGLPLDRYENAGRPMMPQKVQLEVGRPQAPLNSYHVAKKPPNQTLPLQPFQLAFGHQVNRQVFRQGPPPPNPVAAFPPQKQPQPQQQQGALPQMQLFENFYPMQQPPSQQPQDFGLQPAGPLGQSHLTHHGMVPYPFPHNPDMNPELRKALLQEPAPQPVLPQAQIAFPRRSRRLSKEGVLPSTALDGAGTQPGQEPATNLFLHHWPPKQPPPGALGQPHPEGLRFPLELRDSQLLSDGERLAPNGRERGAPGMGCEEGMRAVGVGDCGQVLRGGVIQSTRRRRRASQEANLLTLAQKAVELASLQNAKVRGHEVGAGLVEGGVSCVGGGHVVPGPQRHFSHVIDEHERTHTFQGGLGSLHANNLCLGVPAPEGETRLTHTQGCGQEAQHTLVGCTLVGWLLHWRLEGLGVVGGACLCYLRPRSVSRPSMLEDKTTVVVTQVIILVRVPRTVIKNRCTFCVSYTAIKLT